MTIPDALGDKAHEAFMQWTDEPPFPPALDAAITATLAWLEAEGRLLPVIPEGWSNLRITNHGNGIEARWDWFEPGVTYLTMDDVPVMKGTGPTIPAAIKSAMKAGEGQEQS
jgi:hypothetical protein